MMKYLLLLMILLPGGNVHAAGDTEAVRHFVDDVGSRMIQVINASDISTDKKKSQLQALFEENVDIPWMGQFVLGRAWQQATQEQRNRYMEAYTQYLLTHYSMNFSSYGGSRYKITGVNGDEHGMYNVNMEINAPDANTAGLLAGYRLRMDGSGRFKIVDIMIEGVSLLATERSEFGAVLSNGGMDALIRDLVSRSGQETVARIN